MRRESGFLIIFSGLPGSGKSTLSFELAKYFSATYVRIDTIEQALKDICGITQVEGMGYRLSYRIAEGNLRAGNIVIADSVNGWPITRNEWNDVAKKANVPFLNVEIVCSDKKEHRKRVENRISTIPGHILLTWQEVLNRDYKTWDEQPIVIDTSGRMVSDCLRELITTIETKTKLI